MKILGVDFGSKRVGIAVADTEANMAFPKTVLENNNSFFEEFKKICETEKVSFVVLGESKDFNMEDNKIMEAIRIFKKQIEGELNLTVVMHPEFMTSQQAIHEQGENNMLDASAATIILQSYLDKFKEN